MTLYIKEINKKEAGDQEKMKNRKTESQIILKPG